MSDSAQNYTLSSSIDAAADKITFAAGCKFATWSLKPLRAAIAPNTIASRCGRFSLTLGKSFVTFVDLQETDPLLGVLTVPIAAFTNLLNPAPTRLKPDYQYNNSPNTAWADIPDSPEGFLISHGDISKLTLNDFLALQEQSAAREGRTICSVSNYRGAPYCITMTSTNSVTLLPVKASS